MNVASRRTSTTIINRRVSRLGPVAAAAAPSQAREVREAVGRVRGLPGNRSSRWTNAVGGIDGPGSADAVTFFGTDYSAEPIESTVNEIPNLGISRDVLEMLERKNAAVVSAIQGISCYQEC